MALKTKRTFSMKNHRLYLIHIGSKQEIARYYESSMILYGQAGFVIYSIPARVISRENVSKIEEIPDDQQQLYEAYISEEEEGAGND